MEQSRIALHFIPFSELEKKGRRREEEEGKDHGPLPVLIVRGWSTGCIASLFHGM